jgi:eukaryotic-like serine/threonine-protein kinase
MQDVASPFEVPARSLKDTAPPKPAREPEAGLPCKLGRFTLLKPIARGGMGEVFLATTGGIEGAERPCVVKIIRREHVADPSFLARFFDEARIQAQLDHPGVARVLEASTDPTGKPFVAVEYVEGRNLAELRNRGSQLHAMLQWADAVAIAVSLAEALCYVHERTDHEGRPLGIVHRDLSPQNVMVAYGGDVKLIDFGTARGENRRCHTVSGVVLAKPGYIAPEVANDTPGGVAADLYALGIILWELVAGRRFLTGDPQAHVRAVASGRKIPSPLAALVKAPPELDTLVARLTAPRIEDRYPTARDAMSDLVRLLKKAPSLANGERSVRGRIAHLMDRLYPAEPMRSRAELARLVGAARDTGAERAEPIAPSPTPPGADGEGLFPGTRYRIVGELGRGAMGVVYEAEHVDIGRRVALKVLPKERCGSADAEERFRKEARAVARLRHDNLVLLHDFGIANDGRPYYAMELCEGHALDKRLAVRGPLPWREVLALGAQACRALETAHAAGLVHRDVKPGNLLITDAGTLKLLDFGVVHTGSEVEHSDPEAALRLTGTLEYMAPEQALGQPVDAKADLYALGAVLYECLTAERPHGAGSLVQLVDKKLGEDPMPPSRRLPSARIPKAVDAVIRRALCKRPSGRYASAAEMRAALEGALRSPGRLRGRLTVAAVAALSLGASVVGVLSFEMASSSALGAHARTRVPRLAAFQTVAHAAAPDSEDAPIAILHEVPEPRSVEDVPSAIEPSAEGDAPGREQADAALRAGTPDTDEEAGDDDRSDAEDDGADAAERLRASLARIDRYSREGRDVKALSLARRLAKTHPEDARVLKAWSETAIDTKGWGEALRAAIKWASVDSDTAAHIHLARVQKAVGQRYGAIATLERILAEHPEHEAALELLGRYSPARLALR